MQRIEKAIDSSVTADSGGFTGYASRFLNIDRQGDMILPGAYAKALPEFLDDGGVILADHVNKTMAVAATLRDASEDKSGLLISGGFSATETGQRLRQLLKEKAVNKMSISFMAASKKVKESDIHAIWKRYGYQPSSGQMQLSKSGANLISDVNEILEVSFVPIPANREAGIISVKSHDGTPAAVEVVERARFVELVQRASRVETVLAAASGKGKRKNER